jgi:RNA polymerase sporulation-specific sigma factor
MDNEIYERHLHVLDPYEYEVVVRRYGLRGFEKRTQKEVGNELGVSWSFVSRVEKRGIFKIKHELIKE